MHRSDSQNMHFTGNVRILWLVLSTLMCIMSTSVLSKDRSVCGSEKYNNHMKHSYSLLPLRTTHTTKCSPIARRKEVTCSVQLYETLSIKKWKCVPSSKCVWVSHHSYVWGSAPQHHMKSCHLNRGSDADVQRLDTTLKVMDSFKKKLGPFEIFNYMCCKLNYYYQYLSVEERNIFLVLILKCRNISKWILNVFSGCSFTELMKILQNTPNCSLRYC